MDNIIELPLREKKGKPRRVEFPTSTALCDTVNTKAEIFTPKKFNHNNKNLQRRRDVTRHIFCDSKYFILLARRFSN